MTSLRLVFAGSPAAAVPSLRLLAAGEHEIAGVVTREDSPLGRKGILTPTAVSSAASAVTVNVGGSVLLLPGDVTSSVGGTSSTGRRPTYWVRRIPELVT